MTALPAGGRTERRDAVREAVHGRAGVEELLDAGPVPELAGDAQRRRGVPVRVRPWYRYGLWYRSGARRHAYTPSEPYTGVTGTPLTGRRVRGSGLAGAARVHCLLRYYDGLAYARPGLLEARSPSMVKRHATCILL